MQAPDTTSEDKRFATLAAQYALSGHSLIRAQTSEGSAPYYCSRWGWIRPVASLEHAEQLLQQIAGTK